MATQPHHHLQPPLASSSSIQAITDILTRRQGASGYGGSRATANAILHILGARATRASISAALKLTDHDVVAKRSTRHSPRLRGRGDAARATQLAEASYRAGYVANAAERIASAMEGGATLGEALRRERTWYRAHETARRNRQDTAQAVDVEAGKYGALLGWFARDDGKTSPECKAAHGANFRAGQRPAIGYPGSVHPHCRCVPGPPFATRATVDSRTTRLSVAKTGA
jgi:hypothetical protein